MTFTVRPGMGKTINPNITNKTSNTILRKAKGYGMTK